MIKHAKNIIVELWLLRIVIKKNCWYVVPSGKMVMSPGTGERITSRNFEELVLNLLIVFGGAVVVGGLLITDKTVRGHHRIIGQGVQN